MFFANFDHIYPPHDTHGWKNLKHPTSRQNFGDAPGQTPKLILTLCHTHCCQVLLKSFPCFLNTDKKCMFVNGVLIVCIISQMCSLCMLSVSLMLAFFLQKFTLCDTPCVTPCVCQVCPKYPLCFSMWTLCVSSVSLILTFFSKAHPVWHTLFVSSVSLMLALILKSAPCVCASWQHALLCVSSVS